MKPLLTLLTILLAATFLAAEEPILPAEAKSLLPDKPFALSSQPEFGGIAFADVTGAPRSPIVRATSTGILKKPWDVMLKQDFSAPIAKDQLCLYVIKARCVESDAVNGLAKFSVSLRNRGDSGANPMWREIEIPKKWTTYFFAFSSAEEVPAGQGAAQLTFGYRQQVVEIADVQLYLFPIGFNAFNAPRMAATYDGREPNAPWRKAADERIAKYRQGPITINIVDAAGKPVAGAKVNVQMTRHAFGFGSAVESVRLAGLSETPDPENNARYRSVVDELFSRIVPENDFKMGAFPGEGELSETDAYHRRVRAALSWVLQWATDHHITVRGHYLGWCYLEPWSRKLKDEGRPEAILDQIKTHSKAAIDFGKGWLCEWDVLNHPIPFNQDDALVDFLGPDAYANVYKDVRPLTALPMFINEDTFNLERTVGFEQTVRHMIAQGAKPEGAGFQSHHAEQNLPSMDEEYATWDRLGTLVNLLTVTEYDLTTTDDQLHADHLRDMLTLCFSHPQMTGFVIWGFWETNHWKPTAALFKADWSERPAVQVWRDLVKGKWWTNAKLTSNDQGIATAPAYYGWHGITVEKDGKTKTESINFTNHSKSVTISLDLMD